MYEMSDCVSVVEKRRNEYGMTVRALSQKSGVQEDALYNILGKKRKMTASELLSLSAVLHLNATGNYRITYRQALSLFAKAAAKQTDRLDMQDIVSQIGVTDAVEGVQLATLFFNASTRAGRLRISKR